MPALFLALLTSALALIGARPARLTARLADALGGSAGLLIVAWITAIAASVLAGWAGAWLAPLMPPAGKAMFVAAALVVSGLELLFAKPDKAPAEPTRSLGAIAVVLFASQVTDAARFFVLALAVATGGPVLAAVGGALGSGAVLTAAWALGDAWSTRLPLRAIQLGVGGLFALAAVVVGLAARGVIG
ncbi:MAG: TMEM165/GDT1 family protein [Croceibacterium sp.]